MCITCANWFAWSDFLSNFKFRKMRYSRRMKILGVPVVTLAIVGGAAYLFRKQLAPLVDKIKGMFSHSDSSTTNGIKL